MVVMTPPLKARQENTVWVQQILSLAWQVGRCEQKRRDRSEISRQREQG